MSFEKKLVFLIIICILLLSNKILAEEYMSLSYQESEKIYLNKPDEGNEFSLINDIEREKERIKRLRMNKYPQPVLTFQRTDSEYQNNLDVSLTIRQNIYDFGYYDNQIQMAQKNIEIANMKEKINRSRELCRIKKIFWQVESDKKTVKFINQEINNLTYSITTDIKSIINKELKSILNRYTAYINENKMELKNILGIDMNKKIMLEQLEPPELELNMLTHEDCKDYLKNNLKKHPEILLWYEEKELEELENQDYDSGNRLYFYSDISKAIHSNESNCDYELGIRFNYSFDINNDFSADFNSEFKENYNHQRLTVSIKPYSFSTKSRFNDTIDQKYKTMINELDYLYDKYKETERDMETNNLKLNMLKDNLKNYKKTESLFYDNYMKYVSLKVNNIYYNTYFKNSLVLDYVSQMSSFDR